MRARRQAGGGRAIALVVAGALVGAAGLPLAAGCRAASPAPPGARSTMDQAQRTPRGAWINLVTDRGEVAGELLAVEARALVVASRRGFARVPVAQIRSWSLAWYEADNASVIGYGILGTLSTLSHGAWLIFTAPLLWIIPTPIMARAQSKQGHESSDEGNTTLRALTPYARFPAGLPPGFDPTAPRPSPPSPP